MKRTEVNKSALAFPNSNMKLDITASFDKQSNELKYTFNVSNLEDIYRKGLEDRLTHNIEKEIKNFALNKIIEER